MYINTYMYIYKSTNKLFGELFPYIEVWLTDEYSNVLEIENTVNLTCYLFINLALII